MYELQPSQKFQIDTITCVIDAIIKKLNLGVTQLLQTATNYSLFKNIMYFNDKR